MLSFSSTVYSIIVMIQHTRLSCCRLVVDCLKPKHFQPCCESERERERERERDELTQCFFTKDTGCNFLWFAGESCQRLPCNV